MVTRRQQRADDAGTGETPPLPSGFGDPDTSDDDTVVLDTVVDITMIGADRMDADPAEVLEEALLETADTRPVEYTPSQLVNDPLLAADDEIVADLGLKLRWAAFLYGLVGVALAWTVAAQLTIGLGSGLGAYAWAAGATIAILAIGIWYFAHVADAYRDADSYRASRSAYTLRRLDRGRVILLTEELGRWIAFALGGFLLVVGGVTALLFLVNPNSGARLIPLATIPVVVAYVFGFIALTYRLVDRARDAAA
ncbi:hypothetical protein [Diaminobutyricibacter sp. McL0608]|uniref:hypothetical protein n=1 Tax=Leifsonia sp. McL0608 TaxID=3143537 RepID=UPI0031F30BEC